MNTEMYDYIYRMVPDIARKCGCKQDEVWEVMKELSIYATMDF